MYPIHGQIHCVFSELIQLQPIDLHHEVESGALGLFSESNPNLGIHAGHDHFAVLIGEGDPQLVVALFDPMESQTGYHRTVRQCVGCFAGVHRVERAEDADFAAVIDGGVTQSEDLQFQRN